MAVGEEGIGRQVRDAFLDHVRDAPPALEIGWPPPSDVSEKLTASSVPFGQKPGAVGFG